MTLPGLAEVSAVMNQLVENGRNVPPFSMSVVAEDSVSFELRLNSSYHVLPTQFRPLLMLEAVISLS